MAGKYSQDVQDRAREWVNENHPSADGAEWDRLFEEACRDIAGIDAHNDRADRAGVPPYGPAQRHSAQTMAKDCHGADLAVGDAVSIDKVGEGTVSSVTGDTVRIRVPGATPEEESFNANEIQFWRVHKLSRVASFARTSGYVYELEGGANWQSAPDDAWDTVVATVDGNVVGRRRIDGSTVVVIEQGGKHYAVLPQNVTMSGATTMERRRVDLGFGHTYVNDDRPMPEHGSLIAESEDGGQIEYWTYRGRGEWAYQGKRVTVHARGAGAATTMSGPDGGEPNPYCTGCGRVVTLEPDGRVPEHNDDAHRSTNPGGRCPGSGQKPSYEGQHRTQRLNRDDDLLDEWLDDWVLLTTGQIGLVQTVRGGNLSVDIAAGPLDHIDDAGWHTVLVPPSMVRRKLNWDEIQRLRTPEGWTSGHAPKLSGSTGGARTMATSQDGAELRVGDRVRSTIDGMPGKVIQVLEGDTVVVRWRSGLEEQLSARGIIKLARDGGTAMAALSPSDLKPGDKIRWSGKQYEVIEVPFPNYGSVKVRGADGAEAWLAIAADVKKLSTMARRRARVVDDGSRGAQTMAFRNQVLMPGDRLTVDGATKIVARLEEHKPTPGDFESGVTVHFTDGTKREWGGFDPFWQKRDNAGTYADGGATTTMARVKARFVDDNTAQFKKDQIVYVDEDELKSGKRHIWISEDPDGSRGAYGFASDVEILSAPTSQLATRNGVTGRVVRRYSLSGVPWLLIATDEGTVSWPAAEAQVMGNALNTRVVAGHSLKLRVGVRYRASRPMADDRRSTFPVTIAPIDGSDAPPIVINGLSYDDANALINEFNNGSMSFDGRVWMARGDSQFADLARLHGAVSVDESGPTSGAKFKTKAAADAFADDVQAGIGRRPKVSVSPLDSTKWWAQIQLSSLMAASGSTGDYDIEKLSDGSGYLIRDKQKKVVAGPYNTSSEAFKAMDELLAGQTPSPIQSLAATTMAQALDKYGTALQVGDRIVNTSDGGQGTITRIVANVDGQPSLEVKWDDGSEHGAAPAWVQKTMARTTMASQIGASEDTIQVGDQAKVFHDGVECEGVVTATARHGVIGVSLQKSGRLNLPAGTSIGVSTADVIGVWRSGRQVF